MGFLLCFVCFVVGFCLFVCYLFVVCLFVICLLFVFSALLIKLAYWELFNKSYFVKLGHEATNNI